MKILNYIIPEQYQNNDFLLSLSAQFEKKGALSQKQELALRSLIEIEDDFFEYDVEILLSNENYEDFKLLKDKYTRNRFKFARTKNTCIRAMQSIIYDEPNYGLINRALGRDWQYRRYN